MSQSLRMAMLVFVSMILTLTSVHTASAHQPFFEDDDFSTARPWTVADPTISTALYATLASTRDVDYVTFEGEKGQSILFGLTIPRIEGQENFTPTLAVLGPGLPKGTLPRQITQPRNTGAIVLQAPPGPARLFAEPFSGTSYCERQETRISLPADGQ